MHRICGRSSSGRAPPCQGGGSEFEPRRPLQYEAIVDAEMQKRWLFCFVCNGLECPQEAALQLPFPILSPPVKKEQRSARRRSAAPKSKILFPLTMPSNDDDRRQWRKQGGVVGAAASKTRVPSKARCGCWVPQPVRRGGHFKSSLLQYKYTATGRRLCLHHHRDDQRTQRQGDNAEQGGQHHAAGGKVLIVAELHRKYRGDGSRRAAFQ